MRHIAAMLVASLPLAWVSSSASAQEDTTRSAQGARPNIIFVMVDDMGYGDLGVYGQQHIRMPNVDQMARQGIRYTDAYAGSTVCAPSRSVLMTGQHTGHTTVRGNTGRPGHGGVPCTGGGGGMRVPLTEDDITVAQVLKDAGYVTGITGKWGLGEPGTTGIPNRQGFDEWLGLLNQRRAHSHYPEFIWHNEEKMILEGNTGTRQDFVTEQHHTHDLFTEFALDFIRRHGPGEAPFFLYLPYTVPHDRFQIPELEPYTRDTQWPPQAKVYASMLTRTDRDMGRMLQLLEELGIDQQTIIFFCSDNGAANRYEGLFDSSGPLRGRKRDMYEGGLRTVMVARWPGRIQPDSVSRDIWYFADVLPTFAELAGAPVPDGIDGVSILPSLLSQPQPELHQRPLYWEFHERGFQQAARRGDWKAVRRAHDAPLELYNLAQDVGEQHDIAVEHPEQAAWFEQFLLQSRTASPNWPTPIDDP
ncbi:MAG: sulfatase [Planctomycetaceae bacterium]|nr:MAG: sulfatase [Planctomycetaceae bacterium]